YSGPSCSGKTTLGRALTRILPNCSLINQDNFYKPDSEIPVDPATGLDNWDTPDALDFPRFTYASNAHLPTPPTEQVLTQGAIVDDDAVDDQLIEELRQQYSSALAGYRFVVVDGFLLFTNPEIVARLDVRIFVTASRETLKRRREARVGYITVEGFWQDPPGYFDRIVWPNFILHHQSILDQIHKKKEEEEEETTATSSTIERLLVLDSDQDNAVTSLRQLLAHVTTSLQH
ncbi:P-loop containing nucleoside triphosphate hydrolase protein, partial [Syncephalis plumigaleata]